MPTLSSLIVQREVATMRSVEDAIARQVLHGGDLATNLLELQAVKEEDLSGILAENYGLEPAPVGKLPPAEPAALRCISGEQALRYSVFPLALEGRTLVIVTSEPLSPAVEEDLSFALEVKLRQLAAPLVRIRQAIADHYGFGLDRRFQRLVAKLEGRPDPSPSSIIPAVQGPGQAPVIVPPTTFGTGVLGSARYASAPAAVPKTPIAPAAPPGTITVPENLGPTPRISSRITAQYPGLPSEPGAAKPGADRETGRGSDAAPPPVGDADRAPSRQAEPRPQTPGERPPATLIGGAAMLPPPLVLEGMTPIVSPAHAESAGARPGSRPPGAAPEANAASGPSSDAAPTSDAAHAGQPGREPSEPPREAGTKRPSAFPAGGSELPPDPGGSRPPRPFRGLIRRTNVEERPRDSRPPRRKGPFTAAMAEVELQEASSTDAVLDVFFDFAQQFFQYAALFSVHDDLAEGRDAAGTGADRAQVRRIGIPLDLPSTVARARDRRVPICARFANEGLDAELLHDLQRAGGPHPPEVAIIPLVVRSRTVALLYGDDGPADVELSSLGDVIALAGLVGGAVERVILKKKLGTLRPPDGSSPRSRVARPRGGRSSRSGAVALARALALPGSQYPAAPTTDRPSDPGSPREEDRPQGRSPRAESVRTDAVVVPDAAEPGATRHASSAAPPMGLGPPPADMLALGAASEAIGMRDTLTSSAQGRSGERMPQVSPGAESVRVPMLTSMLGLEHMSPAVAGAREPLIDEDSGEDLGKAIARMIEAPPGRDSARAPALSARANTPGALDRALAATEPSMQGSRPADAASSGGEPRERSPSITPSGGTPKSSPPSARAPDSSQARVEGADSPGKVGTEGPSVPRRAQAPSLQAWSRGLIERWRDDAPRREDPLNPPPNAISSPNPHMGMQRSSALPPFAPPPATAAATRPHVGRPIPRSDADDPETPGVSSLVAAMDASPAPRKVGSAPPAPNLRKGGSSPPPRKGSSPPQRKPLPSGIDGADFPALLEQVIKAGPESNAAFAELVRQGEHSMPTIIASFPGPLRVDRLRARTDLPAASQCGPILALVVAIRRPALPFVTVRITSTDSEIRFWAAHVLGELRYSEAANALVPRLFDDDVSVRRIARRSAAALVNAGPAGQPIVQGLDFLTRNVDEPISRRVMAIETMAEIRTASMVPGLISVLGDLSDDVAVAARRGLLLITRQDFGRDGKRWALWWNKNSGRHRIEWLIDALMHETPALRRAAGDELKLLTKEYFGYYDDLPKKERERAQGRYREWWEREGQARFR